MLGRLAPNCDRRTREEMGAEPRSVSTPTDPRRGHRGWLLRSPGRTYTRFVNLTHKTGKTHLPRSPPTRPPSTFSAPVEIATLGPGWPPADGRARSASWATGCGKG